MHLYKTCNYHTVLMDTLLNSDFRPVAGLLLCTKGTKQESSGCADGADQDHAGSNAGHAAERESALLGHAHGRLQFHPWQRHL